MIGYNGYSNPNYGVNYNNNYAQPQNYAPPMNFAQAQGYNQQMMASQQLQQQSQPQPQPQIQNGGFMQIPSEEMARTYPVAPGNCVTFKIEGKPIVMEKSMGFSQLEAPRIDRYRLVREEDTQNEQNLPQNGPKNIEADNKSNDELKDEIKRLWDEINKLKDQLDDQEGA